MTSPLGTTRINPTLEPQNDPAKKRVQVGSFLIPETDLLSALLYGFRYSKDWRDREYYFWRAADEIWNLNPDLPEPLLQRNPWSERTIRCCLKEKYLAIGGSANSAKSHTVAAYAIIRWLSWPGETQVLVTSTSLTEARGRVWGSLIRLISVIEENAPCAIKDSVGIIAFRSESGRVFDSRGIQLVAAEKSKEKEASKKFIGRKAKQVLVVADELSELSPAIIEACMSNLSKNPSLQVIAMSNPASRFDAFGDWACPKDGWDKVNPLQDEEWRTTRGGLFIRFDGEKSPNMLAGKTIYPYLPTPEQIQEDKEVLGDRSKGYMRMTRAVFFDTDDDEAVYTESDMIRGKATNKAQWLTSPTAVAGFDPGFTNGGDRCLLHIGYVGYDTWGRLSFEFGPCVALFDDANNKSVPRSYQIVEQVKAQCLRYGVSPENLAVDATGAGNPLCDVLAGEWSPKILRVIFNGKPTDRRISDTHPKTGDELFVDRCSELWYVGKELLRTEQLRGIVPELANEMVKRGFSLTKGSGTMKIKLESKKEFKKRLGRSPDRADAAFLALDAARTRFGISSIPLPEQQDGVEPSVRRRPPPRKMSDFKEAFFNEEAYLPYS
jgi:hypothetical protein